jgi:hypothetical protein
MMTAQANTKTEKQLRQHAAGGDQQNRATAIPTQLFAFNNSLTMDSSQQHLLVSYTKWLPHSDN